MKSNPINLFIKEYFKLFLIMQVYPWADFFWYQIYPIWCFGHALTCFDMLWCFGHGKSIMLFNGFGKSFWKFCTHFYVDLCKRSLRLRQPFLLHLEVNFTLYHTMHVDLRLVIVYFMWQLFKSELFDQCATSCFNWSIFYSIHSSHKQLLFFPQDLLS